MDTLEEDDSDDDKIVQEKSSKTKRFDQPMQYRVNVSEQLPLLENNPKAEAQDDQLIEDE